MGQKLGCQLAQNTFSLAPAHQLLSNPMNSFYIFKCGVHWKWRTGSILPGRPKKKKKKSHKQCIRLFLRGKKTPNVLIYNNCNQVNLNSPYKTAFLGQAATNSWHQMLQHISFHQTVTHAHTQKILLMTLYFKSGYRNRVHHTAKWSSHISADFPVSCFLLF